MCTSFPSCVRLFPPRPLPCSCLSSSTPCVPSFSTILNFPAVQVRRLRWRLKVLARRHAAATVCQAAVRGYWAKCIRHRLAEERFLRCGCVHTCTPPLPRVFWGVISACLCCHPALDFACELHSYASSPCSLDCSPSSCALLAVLPLSL